MPTGVDVTADNTTDRKMSPRTPNAKSLAVENHFHSCCGCAFAALNADPDVATDNALRPLVYPTTSTDWSTRRTIESSKSRRWHGFHDGHKSSADEDAMTATTRIRTRSLP